MSKKQGRCSSFAENKERKKKRKLDEEGEDEPAATMEKEDVADNLANWTTFVYKQPRNLDEMYISSRTTKTTATSVTGKGDNSDHQNKQKSITSSSSATGGRSSSTDINDIFLVYKKSLTESDVSTGKLRIPLVFVREYANETCKTGEGGIVYESVKLKVIDHEGKIWKLKGSLCGLPRICVFESGSWSRIVKKYDLKEEDDILLSQDPDLDLDDHSHLLIKFETKVRKGSLINENTITFLPFN